MSRIHYWSDLHIGHDFVAKTRGFEDIISWLKNEEVIR